MARVGCTPDQALAGCKTYLPGELLTVCKQCGMGGLALHRGRDTKVGPGAFKASDIGQNAWCSWPARTLADGSRIADLSQPCHYAKKGTEYRARGVTCPAAQRRDHAGAITATTATEMAGDSDEDGMPTAGPVYPLGAIGQTMAPPMAPPTQAPAVGSLESMIAAAVAPMLRPTGPAPLTADEVREIAAKVVAEAVAKIPKRISLPPAVKLGEQAPQPTTIETLDNDLAGASDSDIDGEYIPQNGEVDALLRGIRLGQNVLLKGPAGCGKTLLAQTASRLLRRALVTVQGSEGVREEHIVGYRDTTEKNGATVTVWTDGLIPRAMVAGAVLYLDEPNALPPGLRYAAYGALDHRREMTLAEDGGRVVRAAPGFCVIASMNEGAGYAGTTPLSFALLQRFHTVIELGYLPKDRETELLVDRTGINKPLASQLVDLVGRVRVAIDHGTLKRCAPVGTRTLLAMAARIVDGEEPRLAAQYTIEGLALQESDRKALRDAADAVLGPAPTVNQEQGQ